MSARLTSSMVGARGVAVGASSSCSSRARVVARASSVAARPCPSPLFRARCAAQSAVTRRTGRPAASSALKTSAGGLTSVEDAGGFKDVLKRQGDGVFVVDWMASWCRKCIYLKPKVDKLSYEFPGTEFVVVDVNKVPQEMIKAAGVSNMPTLQVWKGGAPIEGMSFEAGGEAGGVIDRLRGYVQDAKAGEESG